jgi:hypothetical protein
MPLLRSHRYILTAVVLRVIHFTGIAVILVAIPLTQKITAFLKNIQKELSRARDERVKLNNEVLSGIKVRL